MGIGNPYHLNYATRYLGPWDGTVRYDPGAVVLDNGGGYYICVGASTGEDPSDATSGNWQPYDPPGGTSLPTTYVAANPLLTVTYNGDGTVASTTENGIVTTFTWNTDGTVATQTRAGITRTFSYGAFGPTGAI